MHDDWIWLEVVELARVVRLRPMIMDQVYMHTLVEHWDNKRNIFHFPMREMNITLKEIYKILRVPIER